MYLGFFMVYKLFNSAVIYLLCTYSDLIICNFTPLNDRKHILPYQYKVKYARTVQQFAFLKNFANFFFKHVSIFWTHTIYKSYLIGNIKPCCLCNKNIQKQFDSKR